MLKAQHFKGMWEEKRRAHYWYEDGKTLHTSTNPSFWGEVLTPDSDGEPGRRKIRMRAKVAFGVLAVVMMLATPAVWATNLSFTGTFTHDDNVQLFTFVVGAPSTVTLRTWSYAGGVNAAGATIARGGFDPILGSSTARAL